MRSAATPVRTMPQVASRLESAEVLVDPTFEIREDGTIVVPDLTGCRFQVDVRRVRKVSERSVEQPVTEQEREHE